MLEACQLQVITKIYSISDRSREITVRIDFRNRRGGGRRDDPARFSSRCRWILGNV